MAETVIYDPSQGQGFNNALPWMLAGNGGLGGFNNGLGAGLVGFLIGAWLGNGNGNGFFGGGNNNGDTQRELINAAIMSQGEASRAATQNLATMLGQDFNLVNSSIQTIQSALSSLAIQQAVSVPQVVNELQSGNNVLMSKLCDCCCENRLLTTQQGYESRIATIEQTNALGSAISGNGQRTVDAIADLKTTMVQEFCNVKEREMQDKINAQSEIITQLRGQIDNANQTSAITGYINAMVSPIAKEVDDIKCKLPNTVSVTYPNLYAVNATPYVSGGYYQGGFNGYYGGGVPGFGNGFNF